MQQKKLKDSLQWMQAKLRLSRRDFLKMTTALTAATGATTLGENLFITSTQAAPSTVVQRTAALDIWNLPAFTPASGIFRPDSTWTTIAQQYRLPEWYRDAKFGILHHWSPQSVAEYGDGYARHMYQQSTADYVYHLAHYGHPSKFGYKDLAHLFTGSQWDPSSLLQLYVQQGGAKYFVAMANDNGNYDNWDSTYQPWNSQTTGRKSDIVGEWAAATRAQNVPFGVTYRACPGPTWGLFLPARYNHDTTGTYAGVPYDGVQTAADGKGLWWDGLDPVDINGPVHSGINYHPQDSDPFVRQFYWRIDDLITKHKPDLLDFDASIIPGDPTVITPDYTIPNQSYVIAANYYNKGLQWNNGKQQVVLSIKNVPAPASSVIVQDYEGVQRAIISDYPWQNYATLGPWHYYAPNPITLSTPTLISHLIGTVSTNGNYLLNIPLHGDGHLDQAAITIVQSVGNWLKVNGEAIYATRPFAVPSEGGVSKIYFTRNGGTLYAFITSWPVVNTLTIASFQKGSPYLGNVTRVELLGHSGTLSFTQNSSALTIQLPSSHSSSEAYVFKVTQDKVLVNNDDKGLTYVGKNWVHQANRNLGDSNNNIHMTTNNGDSVSYTFTGTGVDYITETNSDEGSIAIYIDGSLKKTVNGYSSSRKAQVTLYSITGLAHSSHTIKLVKISGTLMLLDALKIHP